MIVVLVAVVRRSQSSSEDSEGGIWKHRVAK